MSDCWPFPAPVDDGGADGLKPGVLLPDVELASSDGGAVALAQIQGLSALFFYPYTGRPGYLDPPGWDDIPGAHGSTPEMENVSLVFDDLQRLGVRVFGISTQDRAHHQELVGRLTLPFPLLSDAAFILQTALDLPTFEAGAVRYLKRLTLVVDDGKIIKTFYPVHPPDRHPQRVLEWISSNR